MEAGLYECLVGHFADNTPLTQVAYDRHRLQSVLDHLFRLLNTRRGVGGLPGDYGLPDISEVYRTVPEGPERLRRAIEQCVSRYEPRLTRVRATQRSTDLAHGTLSFVLTGVLDGVGDVRFNTTFNSDGQGEVEIRTGRRALPEDCS